MQCPQIDNYGCGGANRVKEEELLDRFCFFDSRVREVLDLKEVGLGKNVLALAHSD